MPFPNFIGRKRLWTREKVLAALTEASKEIKGPLPCLDRKWNKIKKGRLDWPTSLRILEYFHSMARAWLAVGVPMRRVSMNNIAWAPEEENYLLDKAGILTLKSIGAKLGRSYNAVRARLGKNNRIKARENQGYLSAAELAKEYNCPYQRIRSALHDGKIKGYFDQLRNRWQVDLMELTDEAKEILTMPKMHSYKNHPTDTGNYYFRYGLKRTLVNGKLTVVAK